jgi:hypothetical protein
VDPIYQTNKLQPFFLYHICPTGTIIYLDQHKLTSTDVPPQLQINTVSISLLQCHLNISNAILCSVPSCDLYLRYCNVNKIMYQISRLTKTRAALSFLSLPCSTSGCHAKPCNKPNGPTCHKMERDPYCVTHWVRLTDLSECCAPNRSDLATNSSTGPCVTLGARCCLRSPWQPRRQPLIASIHSAFGSHQQKIGKRRVKYSFLRLLDGVSILTPGTPLIIYFQADCDSEEILDARIMTHYLKEFGEIQCLPCPHGGIPIRVTAEDTRHKLILKLSIKPKNISTLNHVSYGKTLCLFLINQMIIHARLRPKPAVGAQYPTVWEHLTLVLRNYNG